MRMTALFMIVLPVFLFAGSSPAAEPEASKERGKVLFSSPALGTTGTTCNACHAEGRGLENATGKKRWRTGGSVHNSLEDAINACITLGLHGKPLPVNTPDMKSLVIYIKSISEKN